MTLLWERAPELVLERGRVEGARAEEQRSHLLPNPSLDVSWNTIPVGETNPPGMALPLRDIPNYAYSFSQPFEIGKRGPRQQAMRHQAHAAALNAAQLLRDRFYDFKEQVAEVAADELRIQALETLAGDSARLAELQRARAKAGDTSELDVDRALLEEQKFQASLAEQREKLAEDLRACGETVGGRCEPFGDPLAASRYLEQRNLNRAGSAERPDVRALESTEAAARASVTLAHNQWIPDPTLRFGYVRDQFLVSGNQLNSLFVGVSFPLPVFDHGQADARAAQAQAEGAARAKQLLLSAAERELSKLRAQAAATERRRAQLRDKTLPLARTVIDRLDAAVRRGAAPLQELLISRRTLGELLVDSSDVDLAAFKLELRQSRVSGQTPPLPAEIAVTGERK